MGRPKGNVIVRCRNCGRFFYIHVLQRRPLTCPHDGWVLWPPPKRSILAL